MNHERFHVVRLCRESEDGPPFDGLMCRASSPPDPLKPFEFSLEAVSGMIDAFAATTPQALKHMLVFPVAKGGAK